MVTKFFDIQDFIVDLKMIIIHVSNSPYDFTKQNCPQNSDRVQFQFKSPERCIIKQLKQGGVHCSVIEHGYDIIEFSNCSTEERGISRVLLCSLKTKWRHNHALLLNNAQLPMF